jgi:hypothetical protein
MIKFARSAFAVLAWVFAACLIVQVFFAGLAIFDDSKYWELHTTFVRMFALIPILLLVFAFLGRMSWGTVFLSIGLFLLIIFQFVSVNLSARAIAALHPVVAMLLIGGAVLAIARSRKISSL